jgi:hypothetical protein
VQCGEVCYIAVGKDIKDIKERNHVQRIMAKKTGMKDNNKDR